MNLNIKELNESARKVFGEDIQIILARCPAFGNEDICVIVSGRQCLEAAIPIATMLKGTISEEVSCAWTTQDGEYVPESRYLTINAPL